MWFFTIEPCVSAFSSAQQLVMSASHSTGDSAPEEFGVNPSENSPLEISESCSNLLIITANT